jgi:hypothetical protein
VKNVVLLLVLLVLFVVALAPACPSPPGTGEPPVVGGPVRISFLVPTLDAENPVADPRAAGGTLVVRVVDETDAERAASIELDLAGDAEQPFDDIPLGDDMAVLADVKSLTGQVLGHGELRHTELVPDEDVTLRLYKPLVYALDGGYANNDGGEAAISVFDLSSRTTTQRDLGTTIITPRVDAERTLHGASDLYMTTDGERLVVASTFVGADGSETDHGAIHLYDPLEPFESGLVDEIELPAVVPPLHELVPIGNGHLALGLPDGPTQVALLIDIDALDVTAISLAAAGIVQGTDLLLRGGDSSDDGSQVFVAAQEDNGGKSYLLRFDVDDGGVLAEASEALEFDEAHDVRVMGGVVYFVGATFLDAGFANSAVEVRTPSLGIARDALALPAGDTAVVDMIEHPGGQGLLLSTTPLFDGGGPRNGCCAGGITISVDGLVTFGPTDSTFASQVGTTMFLEDEAVGGETYFSNDPNGKMSFLGATLDARGPYIDVDGQDNFYMDDCTAVASPWGRRL